MQGDGYQCWHYYEFSFLKNLADFPSYRWPNLGIFQTIQLDDNLSKSSGWSQSTSQPTRQLGSQLVPGNHYVFETSCAFKKPWSFNRSRPLATEASGRAQVKNKTLLLKSQFGSSDCFPCNSRAIHRTSVLCGTPANRGVQRVHRTGTRKAPSIFNSRISEGASLSLCTRASKVLWTVLEASLLYSCSTQYYWQIHMQYLQYLQFIKCHVFNFSMEYD